MGNSCCEGRPNKTAAGSATIQRKPTLISSKLKRDRSRSFKRSASFLGRGVPRVSSNPSSPQKPQGKSTTSEDLVPGSPKSAGQTEPASAPICQHVEGSTPQDGLAALREEDERFEDSLDLEYTLEGGRDCSHTQQKQILALFEKDEELDGLAGVSLLNGKEKFEVLMLAVSSKCLYLLSAFDYSEVKCKIYLRYLRLLGLNSDRTAVAIVYKRGVEGLEYILVSCTKYESLLKAITTVHFEETGKILPSVTHPTIADTEEFISSLAWSALSDLTSPDSLRVQRLFITNGLIGENKLLHVQCLKELQGTERAVQLVVSDRALYTVSYSFILIDRVALETVRAVKFTDPTHVCIVADAEHKFSLPSSQGHDLEETISAYMRRATI